MHRDNENTCQSDRYKENTYTKILCEMQNSGLSIDIMIFRYYLPIFLDSEIYHEHRNAQENRLDIALSPTCYNPSFASYVHVIFRIFFAYRICVESPCPLVFLQANLMKSAAIHRKKDKAVVIVTIDVTIGNNADIYSQP